MTIAELLDELDGRPTDMIVAVVLDGDGGEVQDGDALTIVEAKVQYGHFMIVAQPEADE